MLCKGTYNNTKKTTNVLGRGKNLRAEELCQLELERECPTRKQSPHSLKTWASTGNRVTKMFWEQTSDLENMRLIMLLGTEKEKKKERKLQEAKEVEK
jgi:hypothetical protein